MALRTVPAAFESLHFLGVREKMRDDERQISPSGVPAWSVDLAAHTRDGRTGYPVIENIAVTVLVQSKPLDGVPQGAEVQAQNLQVGAYQSGNGTAFYFSADSVQPAKK